jgi:hypothetical protein
LNSFIFYALISEEKDKHLKISGPFFYHKIDIDHIDKKIFLFDKSQFKSEKGYLSKILREKNPSKISVFYTYTLDNPNLIILKCQCDKILNINLNLAGQVYECTCGLKIDVPNSEKLIDDVKTKAMLAAEKYFKQKFEQMSDNYRVCTRK